MSKFQFGLLIGLGLMIGLASYQIRVTSEKQAQFEIKTQALESVRIVYMMQGRVRIREQEVKLMADWLRCHGECK